MKFFKRTLKLAFWCLTGLIVLVASASQDETVFSYLYPSEVKSIAPDIAKELISSDDVLILDVRGPEEFNVSHMANGIPFSEELLEGISKDQPILLYCTVGYRSALLAKDLRVQGYAHVYNLDGGLIHWKNLNRKVYNLSGHETDSVHVFNNFYGLWLKNGIASL